MENSSPFKKRNKEVRSGTIKGISGGQFRKLDESPEEDISNTTKNIPDIPSNTNIIDDSVKTVEDDINSTGDNNADVQEFIELKEESDGTFATLSVSTESSNSNDNNKPNKHQKKKLKQNERHCKQSEVSESSNNTIWYVSVCSDPLECETQKESEHICRMCKSKLDSSFVNETEVKMDSQTREGATKEENPLDPSPTDDRSQNTLTHDMEILLDAIQNCFKKVTEMKETKEVSSSKQSNNTHEKIKGAVLKIYRIMDITERTQLQLAEFNSSKIKQQIYRQREEITDITKQNHALMSTVQELSKIRIELEVKVGNLQDEIKSHLAQGLEMNQKLKCLREELAKVHKEFEIKVEKLQDEKESLITRLSSIAGSRLRDGNPTITDLSDDNRPLKIAERFNEIYDNEWTDAFDKLIADKSERESINILLEILQRIYQRCQEISQDQLHHLKRFGIPPDDEAENTSRDSAQERKAKEMQMSCGQFSADLVEMKILKHPDFSTKFTDYMGTCETFIKTCIKTCWMMNMQEVPMCLEFAYQPGDPFKKELFKEYTKCGGQCGYLVWPLLLLHVDGAVLQKGVMQPL